MLVSRRMPLISLISLISLSLSLSLSVYSVSLPLSLVSDVSGYQHFLVALATRMLNVGQIQHAIEHADINPGAQRAPIPLARLRNSEELWGTANHCNCC